MAFHLHRAVRADRLAAALGALLGTPPADPFVADLIVVPTPGVERWLAQQLSHRLGSAPGRQDGVCAGVDFCSPRRLVARALAAASPIDPESDPWIARRAVWPLLEVIDEARGQAWASPVWAYLTRGGEGGSPQGGRRFGLARQLAERFNRYAVSRPTMIDAWRRGEDVDGTGRPLGPDRAWQPEVWRRLRTVIGVPDPAARLASGMTFLREHPESAELPERLSVFGPTRLDPDQLAVLAVLAEHRGVHLWLTHPSSASWDRLADRPVRPRGPRRGDAESTSARHRLLRYLGRDVVELQEQLAGSGASTDERLPDGPTESTLLGRLQADIAADTPLPTCPLDYDPHDRSIGLHACHGPDRQVEVLREVLLGLLADDPTLQPRDIIVMCPDIEAFAPLISATFGLDTGEPDPERRGHPGHRLRVRLADRSLRQLNPLLALVSRLLQLAQARVTAAELLDLLSVPVVARRFHFSEDDLHALAELVPKAGVRWGLDAEHRARYGMGGFGQNTWAAGLDRMLLGVTMDEGEHFIGTALPLDGIDSGDVDRVGRLAEAVDRVAAVLRGCARTQSLGAWVELLRGAVDDLGAVPVADQWQLQHAYGALADLLDGAHPDGANPDGANPDGDGGQPSLLSPADVRALLADTLRGRPSRANFRTGTLTVATLAPMRSVPHRVVCLLGIDDGAFPRVDRADGDDLLADDPWVGDRDRRSEDRQLMLDAIMAATERLVLVYSGADPRTGRARPPAVPVKELLDTLDLTATAADGRPVSAHVITEHSLQPFDPANFTPAAGTGAPRSFDASALAGARALLTERTPTPSLPLRLPPAEPTATLTLKQLTDFFAHPAKALLRARMGLTVSGEDDLTPEQIPVVLDSLQTWAIGNRALTRRLAGADLDLVAGAEWRRGQVPPQQLGSRVVQRVLDNVAELDRGSLALRAGDAATVDLEAKANQMTVTGTVGPVYDDTWVSVGYSFLGAKQKLTGWLALLCLTVSDPGRPWQTVMVGRGGRCHLGPIAAEVAEQHLAGLVDLFATGQNELLPLPIRTAAEYARLRYRGLPVEQARGRLETEFGFDLDDAWRQLLPFPTFAGLVAEPARADEQGELGAPSRFGSLALRMWLPLLGAEQT